MPCLKAGASALPCLQNIKRGIEVGNTIKQVFDVLKRILRCFAMWLSILIFSRIFFKLSNNARLCFNQFWVAKSEFLHRFAVVSYPFIPRLFVGLRQAVRVLRMDMFKRPSSWSIVFGIAETIERKNSPDVCRREIYIMQQQQLFEYTCNAHYCRSSVESFSIG